MCMYNECVFKSRRIAENWWRIDGGSCANLQRLYITNGFVQNIYNFFYHTILARVDSRWIPDRTKFSKLSNYTVLIRCGFRRD